MKIEAIFWIIILLIGLPTYFYIEKYNNDKEPTDF